MPREVRKIKIKLHSKLQALVELGKHLGVKAGVDLTSNGETVPTVGARATPLLISLRLIRVSRIP